MIEQSIVLQQLQAEMDQWRSEANAIEAAIQIETGGELDQRMRLERLAEAGLLERYRLLNDQIKQEKKRLALLEKGQVLKLPAEMPQKPLLAGPQTEDNKVDWAAIRKGGSPFIGK